MTDAKTITLALKGRWLGSYGIAFCPAHENTQTPALSLSNGSNGRLLASCHAGCDFRSIAKALRSEGLVGRNCDSPRSDPGEHARRSGVNKPAQTAKLRARARNLWDQGQPITGTHGEMYLRGRAITGPLPASLRWLPDIYHQPSGQFSSAMIADVQPTGGVHRTLFTK